MASSSRKEPGYIKDGEIYWVEHYNWLKACGYQLRDRYSPDWRPSWKGTGKSWTRSGDGPSLLFPDLNDAKRISDGTAVMLKRINKTRYPHEPAIMRFFSAPPLATEAENHCIPTFDVLQAPDDVEHVIIVMLHVRDFADPAFETFGEAVEFFRQIFEGLRFLHVHSTAHRDCTENNIMMDASELFPDGYHPVHTHRNQDMTGNASMRFTRTEKPPKYYLIDYDLSRQYDAGSDSPLEYPIIPGDKTVPEFQDIMEGRSDGEPINPFPTDVYMIGNLVRTKFLARYHGFEFMEPLITAMVFEDPAARPTMDQVVFDYAQVRSKLSSWKLRARLVPRKEHWIVGIFRGIPYWVRRVRYSLAGIPPTSTGHKSANVSGARSNP